MRRAARVLVPRFAAAGALVGALAVPDRAPAQQRPAPARPQPAVPTPVDTVRRTPDSTTIALPARPDSVERASIDSVRGIPDSLRTPRVIRDSIRPPIARAELPRTLRVDAPYRWTRDSVYTAGALNLADLVERVSGVTMLRAGWLAGVQTAAYLGDFRRVRVFRDGVEIDALDPRTGGALDLVEIQLWDLDEVSIEQSASEVRVHLRSWTVRRTTPFTRVDIYTGDEDSNVYRGFYGKRWTNDLSLQLGGQNLSSGARSRLGGGGRNASLFARIGWARGRFSVDAQGTRLDRTRDQSLALITADEVLGGVRTRRDDGYVRLAWGDPEQGVWAQAIASAGRQVLEGTRTAVVTPLDPLPDGTPQADTTFTRDSTQARSQYLVTGGFTRWGVRLSGAQRVRVGNGRTWLTPSVRAAWTSGPLAIGAFAERQGVDSSSRIDVQGRFTPLPWVVVQGGVGRATQEIGDADESRLDWRAEGGLRLGGLWLTGGRVQRGAGRLAPPAIFTRGAEAGNPRPLVAVREPAIGGTVGAVRGRLYRAVRADVSVTRWDAEGPYRPQLLGRGELRVSTNLLGRFPSGQFGLQAAIFDEYRSATPFPVAGSGPEPELIRAGASNVLGVHLEIRIMQAALTYQLRNALNREYQYVPGITQPRLLNFYGVRWDFFN